MAFTKKPKLCQDAPAGIQQINGLVDNLESLRLELETEHVGVYVDGTGAAEQIDPGNYEPGFGSIDPESQVPGTHDSPLIPRGSAYVQQVSDVGSAVTARLFFANGCLSSFQIISEGVYFFPINGFASVWGKATPYGEDLTASRDARVGSAQDEDTLGTGLIVRTFLRQTSSGGTTALFPYHTGFFLLAYGRRVGVAPVLASPGAMLRRSRFGAGPRGGPVRFPRSPRR